MVAAEPAGELDVVRLGVGEGGFEDPTSGIGVVTLAADAGGRRDRAVKADVDASGEELEEVDGFGEAAFPGNFDSL